MGVIRRMGLGFFFSLLMVLYGILFNPFSFPELLPLEDKLIILGFWFLTPSFWLSVLPLSASCLFIGRILFIKGFRKGASSRAVGFALTFLSFSDYVHLYSL